MPDILVPHKHYANEVIENVLDEVSTPFDESTEDYPCEATMNRWKHRLMKNLQQIEGMLRSVGYTILGFSEKLLKSRCSLLGVLRNNGGGWLSAIQRLKKIQGWINYYKHFYKSEMYAALRYINNALVKWVR